MDVCQGKVNLRSEVDHVLRHNAMAYGEVELRLHYPWGRASGIVFGVSWMGPHGQCGCIVGEEENFL
jgi:hypothetical protein